MITTFLRSSSYNAHTMCSMSYFLAYVLKLPSPAGKKAAKGNVMHKALEVLAWQSYHRARGNRSYVDETFGELSLDDITPDWAVDVSYRHYKEAEPHHDWKDHHDLRDCRKWTWDVLNLGGGYFDPRNMDVVEPEKRFDITIEEPWAHFRYDTPQGVLEGQLGLKGTIDLVVRDKNDSTIIELIDYKSGRRLDWATGEEKTYEKLLKDPQLLLYFLAFSRVFPDVKNLVFTIVFVNDGGPFRMYFGPDELALAGRLIRAKFEEIRDTQYPKPNVTWRCQRLCAFSKPSRQDTSLSICDYFNAEIKEKGADRVFYEHGDIGSIGLYGSGGGRKE